MSAIDLPPAQAAPASRAETFRAARWLPALLVVAPTIGPKRLPGDVFARREHIAAALDAYRPVVTVENTIIMLRRDL